MNSINFDNPWLLLVALPLIIAILVPFFIAVNKDNRNVHNLTSCILHLAIAVCVTLSSAGTTIKSVLTETNVYVVADLSYSTSENLDKIDEYVKNLRKNLPLNTEMGVVCFGATDSHVVHTPLGAKPESVKTALPEVGAAASEDKVDNSATDIVSALRYTSRIFKGGVVKRIVLITDGKQSDESDKNALKRTVDELHAAQIYVDAIYLDSNLPKTAKEIQISSVDYPEGVYVGKKASAEVYIQSTMQTRATVSVTCNGEPYFEEKGIEIEANTQKKTFDLDTSVPGRYSYTVTVKDVEGDENLSNNVWHFTQTIAAEPTTLFITTSPDDEALAKEIYGAKYDSAVRLVYADDPNLPYTVAELCQYDEIVLSNVNVTKDMDEAKGRMFVDNVETVVSLLGKSLIGLGDLSVQNTTNETLLKLADMLPVRYGNPLGDSRRHVIVMDISNSMEQVGKLSLAKDVAKQLVDLLYVNNDGDYVSLYGFAGGGKEYLEDELVSNRDALKTKIDGITGEHNTIMSEGLKEFQEDYENYTETKETQIFVITDGGNMGSDWSPSERIIRNLKKDHDINTTVLAIGEGLSTEGKLQLLAGAGGGSDKDGDGKNDQYYHIKNKTTLTEEILQNISGAGMGEVAVTMPAAIDKKVLSDEVLEGLTITNSSFIYGYVTSREKPNATTALVVRHQRNNASTLDIPLYTHWNYGNGKTASFTSSFSGDWMRNWHNQGLDIGFFSRVFEANTPTQRVDAPFLTTVERQSGGATLKIRPAAMDRKATVQIELVSPDGNSEALSNAVFDVNAYEVSFAMPTVGGYTAKVTYTTQGKSFEYELPIHQSYLAEYDRFTSFDAAPLYAMLGEKGTVSEDGALKIENDEKEVGVRIVDLTMPLLCVAIVLFAADVVVRKMKWADIKNLFRKKKKGGRL